MKEHHTGKRRKEYVPDDGEDSPEMLPPRCGTAITAMNTQQMWILAEDSALQLSIKLMEKVTRRLYPFLKS